MKALIVVDMQNDFSDFGTIKIEGMINLSNQIKDFLNKINRKDWYFVFSRDYHPHNHCSFKQFREHCIKGTLGVEYVDALKLVDKDLEIKKGINKHIDSYSAFFEKNRFNSKLNKKLKELNIDEVYVCGVLKEICVIQTAIDAANFGYKTYIIEDLTKGFEDDKFYSEMNSRIKLVKSYNLLK